jgi:hypothetical protein
MGDQDRHRLRHHRPARRALAIALQRLHRLAPSAPAPAGLAKPGLIAFDLAGDVLLTNADGTGRTQLTSGPDVDTRAIVFARRDHDRVRVAAGRRPLDLRHRHGRREATGSDWQIVYRRQVPSPGRRTVAESYSALISSARGGSLIFVADVDHPSRSCSAGDLQGSSRAASPERHHDRFKHIDPSASTSTLWLIEARTAPMPTSCPAAPGPRSQEATTGC